MSKNSDVIILTPTFDDWDSVFELLAQLDGVLKKDGRKVSVVVVDDGSAVTDRRFSPTAWISAD